MQNLEYNLGVAEDPRSVEEKERDYKTSNLAGAVILNWIAKPQAEWKRYTDREQDGSLSCMAQAGGKACEIIKIQNGIFSAHPPYRSRNNFPSGGMWTQDLGNVFKNIGTNFESVDVSQNIGESQMNRDITVETPFKIGGYGFPDDNKNIDDIAMAIEQHGHCIVVIHANNSEWTSVPVYDASLPVNFGHGICAVDYFLYNGEKAILLEDSTGHFNSIDKKGARIITESYLKARCSGAIYFLLEPPQFIFKTFMKIGYVGGEIKELQKRLNKEGVASPALVVDGKFGKKTDVAVKKYQKTHGLLDDGLVGTKTRKVLNQPVK